MNSTQDQPVMKLLTIGQLAKRVGVRTSTLRYYEEQGLLIPTKRSDTGYRLYNEQAEQDLLFIQRAQRVGFLLSDIRTLLKGWQNRDLSDERLLQIAQDRYLTVEQQLTPLLVRQHELQLFLQDVTQHQQDTPQVEHLLQQICNSNLLNDPPETILDWLIDHTNCQLQSDQGQTLLNQLRGQHVHIWQVEQAYHILVVSNDPSIGVALEALAQLEADCQAHAYQQQLPELMHNDEGYLFIARGEHAFIFARLFLALERS